VAHTHMITLLAHSLFARGALVVITEDYQVTVVSFFENMSWETYLSHRRRGRRPIHNTKNGYNTPLL
jgi:hypothetical protein